MLNLSLNEDTSLVKRNIYNGVECLLLKPLPQQVKFSKESRKQASSYIADTTAAFINNKCKQPYSN